MDIIRKDATITNTDDSGPGAFEVILSAPTLDRDGDTLKPDEWKTPLPDHITFDIDHGMNVASTVGSGTPRIDDETGNLVVSGTYSSLPRAQEVRTLVNEGHIRTTSVAFMNTKTQKDGKTVAVRELLNGAFVAVPSNREALVLASKGIKAGARNSSADAEMIQRIHDTSASLGADCAGAKSLDAAEITEKFTRGLMSRDEARTVLGLSVETKDADTEEQSDPGTLAQAVDAPLDEAIDLFAAVDASTLPAEVQQAIALVQAADAAVDELLDALGVPDPDEDAAPKSAAAPDAAKAADGTAAEEALAEIQVRAARIQALHRIANAS